MSIELSMDDINKLRDAKRLAEETLSSLDKAERAGIDVSAQKKDLNDKLSKINQILSVYG